jgi:RNA methyltransferase, TrmH family
MPIITSLQNPRVKNAVRLRDRRHREKQGRILIDGARELRRAIQGGVKLIEAFVCEPLCQGDDARHLLAVLPASGGEIWQVAEAVFERLAFGQRTEGVLGVAEAPRPTLTDLSARLDRVFHGARQDSGDLHSGADIPVCPEGHGQSGRQECLPHCGNNGGADNDSTAPLIAVLEGVEKPGNVGAVLRTADAAGVSGVVVADARTDLYNPNAIRASLGTIFAMPVCEATSGETLAWLRERGFAIVAARVDSAVPYTQIDFRGPTAIVLGSEATGLSSLWSGNDVRPIRLPMLGAADSLNVSVTAAVLFYEALRQRGVTAC